MLICNVIKIYGMYSTDIRFLIIIFHVKGQRRRENIPSRAQGEVSERKCEWSLDKSERALIEELNKGYRAPSWAFLIGPRSPRPLEQQGKSVSVEAEESPPPSAAGTMASTPALSSTRTRPAISRTCTRRESPEHEG